MKKAPKKAAKNGYAGSTVKRAKNAFMFFCSDKRAALKGELYITNFSHIWSRKLFTCMLMCLCIWRKVLNPARTGMAQACNDSFWLRAE